MLTATQLKAELEYDPLTGVFKWRQSGRGRRKVQVGCLDKTRNRVSIYVLGASYYAHQLAWLYVYGKFPIQELDHINGNGADNSISNLRLATHSQNMQNKKRPITNTSGFKGVIKDNRGRWRATIKDGPTNRHLGVFPTPELAHEAYKLAAQQAFGQFARFE